MKDLVRSVTLMLVITSVAASAKAQSALPKKYSKVPAGYLMVLNQGDNIFEHLEAFAKTENIPSANFTGMGFVSITFGFFNFETKEYEPREFKEVELASMHGSLAWQKGQPSIHSHGVVTGRDFRAYGGHILSGTVSTGSLEIMITVHDKRFEREQDEALGANVLRVP